MKPNPAFGLNVISKLNLFWIATFMVVGCNEDQELQAWAERMSVLRVDAEEHGRQSPYRREQYKALKDYFSEIGGMALTMKDDPKFAERINLALRRTQMDEVCTKVLMKTSDWQWIMEGCQRNDFFLCAEEVRAYPEMVRLFQSRLAADNRAEFEKSEQCRLSLPVDELGF